MRALPLTIGTIHFVGIGGIGMSGIAEVLHNLGYKVQGSDQAEGANVVRLRALGIAVAIGHREENLGDCGVVVISSAVKADNPEVVSARKRLLPVVRRAEMLGELMRLKWSIAVGGTHGKTTTTSLIATVLDSAGFDPTVINGGIINALGTNARLGSGDWMVAEADESDGTFLKLPATIAVVTNIDPEHLDHYGSFDALRKAFDSFVENIPFYGFAALCIDHSEVQSLIPRVSDRRVVTYGFSPQADVRALNLRADAAGVIFDVQFTRRNDEESEILSAVRLPMFGEHNVQNALAAIAIAREMGIDNAVITTAFMGFEGVKRRFTRTGEIDGITIIDDYGHHPVEIAAVLKAARSASQGDVIAVVQPHRYSRLHNLFEDFCTCFNDADAVLVADVYAAGEGPIEGADKDALVAGLRHHGHRTVMALPGPDALAEIISDLARPGDLVVCLGAGSISQWANALPEQLRRLRYGAKSTWVAGRGDDGEGAS
ncbi:UDP-N-acetylmuramate--L-alanine ligase [Varunaivibrio sulfuroxidans]|uniref:UDP-N-acetylmuramate--L-alanine ligase n=1 Tax=Varunaivibrio sulfuroxidans TaxID=1773489 RepID=A0A4R3J9W0_9PROT|nr:UDP-N-acetylmuramate--L-alanine ligase [Varunaivibrio sulfuroxidans]TCS62195.1 UDP-N-acetylmuramate--L-alanine ligase [Varunaivibrio sulfuroxidans]WES30622.1 UDP-N-acetylmuramate--L-alanine ligase [Varunaivibrio sulfuroxidans]